MRAFLQLAAASVWIVAGLSPGTTWPVDSSPASAPATGSAPVATAAVAAASAPATASVPASRIAVVNWHGEFDPAAAEARRRGVLLIVVFFDADSPTCQSYEEQALSDLALRQYLADFAAARLNGAGGDGLKRLKELGQSDTPVTTVYAPSGELLDVLPGAIVPGRALVQAMERSRRYWQEASVKPATPASRWEAVQARLALSTRDQAAAEIERLMNLPPEQLPPGATPGRVALAKGMALQGLANDRAQEAYEQAIKLGGDDAQAAGRALIRLGDLAGFRRQYPRALEHYRRYIRQFPKGPDVGQAYCGKAMIELLPMDSKAAAAETLKEFIHNYPDDPLVVRARELLETAAEPATQKGKP